MEIKRYRAAGGVVVQRGIALDAAPDSTWMLVLDRPARNEVRLPKGHIDADESDEIAALRETTEETGYADLAVVADLGYQLVEYDYKGMHYIREERYFLMDLRSDRQEPQAEEDAAQFKVRWVTLEQALTQLTFEAERRWVQRAQAFLMRSSTQ